MPVEPVEVESVASAAAAAEVLCSRLEAYAELCEQVEPAPYSDMAALRLSLRARQHRWGVAHARKTFEQAGSLSAAQAAALVPRMSVAAKRSRAGDAVLRARMADADPPEDAAVATADGVGRLAELVIPAVFDIGADVVVLCGDELRRAAQVLRELGVDRVLELGPGDDAFSAVAALPSPAPCTVVGARHSAAAVAEDEYQRMIGQARSAIATLRCSHSTYVNFAKTWLDQGMRNLGSVAASPAVGSAREAFAGQPMVIVAPGPSLDRNIDQLHRLQGKAVIATINHAVAALVSAGITPDVVLTADADPLQYHFDGAPVRDFAAMINSISVHPDVYQLPAPRTLTMGSNPVDSWLYDALGETGQLASGGSVATTAFSLALLWQCDPIVVVGLDLSFPGGRYYASGSSDSEMTVDVDDSGQLVIGNHSRDMLDMLERGGTPEVAVQAAERLPGWHGDTVPTTAVFAINHTWMVNTVAANVDRARMLNCTEGGCYIDGMEHVPLADAIELLADREVDVGARLDAVVDACDRARRARRLRAYLNRSIGRCRRIAERARRCRKTAHVVRRAPANMAKLEARERKLLRTLEQDMFVALLCQREITEALAVARHAGDLDEILGASIRLCDVIVSGVDTVIPLLQRGLTELSDV